jgi:uncharacterized membrane protein YcaP (DUF421 family)
LARAVRVFEVNSAMVEFADAILGLSLKSEQLGFGEMAARAMLMYLLLVVIVRSAKKRFLSNATAFDFILTVLIGSVAARAMTGGAPFFPSTLAIVVMVIIHWVFSWIGRESPSFSGLIKGYSTLIVKNGKVQSDAMKRTHMSRDDLDEDLREKGVGDPSELVEARLERSGKLSVIKK